MNHFFYSIYFYEECQKKYPTEVIKTKDGKIDICLTLLNEINWMKEMRSRLIKPVPVDKSLTDSELFTHIMSLMKVLKQIKRNHAELN